MRDDNLGLFWNDVATRGARNMVARVQPPIPDTGWTPPNEFPDLSSARVIALDTETWDPELNDHGPGWARGKGHIVGASLAVDGGAWYFPMRHEVEPEYNLDPETVLRYLRHTLGDARQCKVGGNLTYDIGWLAQEGVAVAGDLMDVQHAEALLSERGFVNLDYLGEKYLGQGKEVNFLYQWLSDFYGGANDSGQRANIYRAPPRLVGPYAERDAVIPLLVAKAQYPILEREQLLHVLEMENGLIPLMVAMRFEGVSVDIPRAELLREKLLAMEIQAQARLDTVAGQHIDVNAADSIARVFDLFGVAYPKTKRGKPSFRKEWLAQQENPAAALVNEVRKLAKLRGTFVESYILNSHVNGKVYGQFHQLRGDATGARSGRFSSSTPNLQNIPSRDEELAPLVRGMFVPDVGHKQWRRYDYSQIEYRFLVHFAAGPGADEARAKYWADPTTDYHDFVIDMIRTLTGFELARKPAKNINFGLIYGMGIPKLLRTLGLSKADGDMLFTAYHKAIPYAQGLMETCSEEAQRTGIITTILGRRSRFELWEPRARRNSNEEPLPALPYDQAIRAYSSVRRAMTHKATNRKLQGSAADMIKYAMWKCWKDGVFAFTGVPRLTVHDELDFSERHGHGMDDAFRHVQHTLENALPGLRVPIKAEPEVGADWGAVK